MPVHFSLIESTFICYFQAEKYPEKSEKSLEFTVTLYWRL